MAILLRLFDAASNVSTCLVLASRPSGQLGESPALPPSRYDFGPEPVAGAADEDVFERRLAYERALNFSRECFDHVGDEAVAVFDFQADVAVHDGRVDRETVANALRERFGVGSFEQNDVAADFVVQLRRRAEGDEFAFVQDGEAVAALGLFHQVRGDDDGDVFLVAQSSARYCQRSRRAPGSRPVVGSSSSSTDGMMQQALGELDAALHAAGESFRRRSVARSARPTRVENFGDARLESGAAQAVEMALVPEVFVGGELGVDALRLEDDADLTAQGALGFVAASKP